MSIEGTTVLVTGANRGIGQALAEGPSAEGRRVCAPAPASRWLIQASGSRR
jgi:NAD(P)-dependent dehydrogenase (short-subunit alcohol dehydrogenase family)